MKKTNKVIKYTILIIAFVCSQFFTALYLGNLINTLRTNDEYLFHQYAIITLVLIAILFLSSVLKRNYIERIKFEIISKKKKLIFRKVISQDLIEFTKNEIGKYTNIFQHDINRFENLYLNSLLNMPEKILMIIICVGLLYSFDIRVLAIALCLTFFMVALPNLFTKTIEKYSLEYQNTSCKFSEKTNDLINNAIYFNFFGTKEEAEDRYTNICEDFRNNKLNLYFNLMLQNNVSLILSLLLSVGILIISSYIQKAEVNNTQVSSLSIAFITGLLSENILEYINLFNKYKSGRTFDKKLKEYEIVEIKHYEKKTSSEQFQKLVFSNFNVRKNKELILDDVNLTINKNYKYLIMGESGSGKSTLIKSIINIVRYDGEIYINDKNVNQMLLEEINDYIAYINGNGKVFDASLSDNISLFDVNTNNKKLEDLCELLNLNTLPDNIEADKLSGGERQKILIARGLYRNCPVIILDEATSEIEYKMQEKIESYIASLEGVTVLNISHKIPEAIIKNYDYLIRVENQNVILTTL